MTDQELKNTPFYKLTNDQKKRLIKLNEKKAAQQTGRSAFIAAMMADVMKECS